MMMRAGAFVGDLVPRCTDPVHEVRHLALKCIHHVLKIQAVYQLKATETDVVIDAMNQLHGRSDNTEANAQFALVNDLSKILAKKIAPEDLLPFMYGLIDTLLDGQNAASSGSCVVLNGIFRLRGPELEGEVNNIITILHDKMPSITHERTGMGVLRSVRTLTAHHLALVVKHLQSYELPYDSFVAAWLHAQFIFAAGKSSKCGGHWRWMRPTPPRFSQPCSRSSTLGLPAQPMHSTFH